MSETVINVENLSKLYQLGEVGTGTISHDLNRFFAKIRGKEDPYLKVGQVNDRTKGVTKGEQIWALKDINFEVQQGEVLGIIGKNGSGKSTLLKLLSRVTAPTTGSIKIKGRVASLLEVGTGFHPEMTGRENIFMNGTILGMTRREIQTKLEEIVEFAGIAKYLDTPTKRYSSGMSVRLAFAVAAFLDPEILIVDEVLAVGDAEFQKRAIGKMQDISKGEERTVIFVSHNMSTVRSICNSAIVIQNGMKEYLGEVNSAVSKYQIQTKNLIRESNGLFLSNIEVSELPKNEQLYSNSALKINGSIKGKCIVEVPYLIINIKNSIETNALLLSSRISQVEIAQFENELDFTICIGQINLMAGLYTMDIKLLALGGKRISNWENAIEFLVEPPKKLGNITLPSTQNRGVVFVNSEWKIKAQ